MTKRASAVVLAVFAIFLISSCATVNNESVTVNVSGSGTVYLKADMVSFQVQVDEKGSTTGEAQNLANMKVSRILSILRSFGIAEEDITTASLNFSTEYEWNSELQKSVRTGERVSQSVYVKMYKIDDFGKLVDELGSSVSGIRLGSVNFDAKDHSEALEKARELAYKDALAKAQTYADVSGYSTVKPVKINDSYYSVSTRETANSYGLVTAKAAGMDSYSTETPVGNLSVNVQNEIEFEIR